MEFESRATSDRPVGQRQRRQKSYIEENNLLGHQQVSCYHLVASTWKSRHHTEATKTSQ